MRRPLADIVLRLVVLIGLGVSAALLWDYFRPLPAFCDVGSGCDRVRSSAFSSLFGVPIPLLGVAGFVALLVASLAPSDRAWRWTRGLSLTAGFAGLSLLLVQALVLKVFCKLCVVVDLASISAACAVLARPLRGGSDSSTTSVRLWAGAGVAALALPGLWSLIQPSPPVPPEIARLWRPNVINVVEFADFQCPFCRELHPAMTELLTAYEGRVNFVRLNMPLASHSQARDAARAYVCGDRMGRGSEMADALFTSQSLTPDACLALAIGLGLEAEQFRACLASPETDARIDEEMRLVKAAGLAGLPTVWIGDQVIVGTRPKETIAEAFERAKSGVHKRWPLGWLWAALALGLAVVGWVAWRASTRTLSRA